MKQSRSEQSPAYLTALGAWALAFGCSVGWGAFVMPGTTFLPIAGPVGSAVGIGLGAAVMLIIGKSYHSMMNRFPGNGGTYTYTRNCFGHDHAFLSAWFLILTYIAIVWANASALPIIGRTLLGTAFEFGPHYTMAGFEVYLGEILLSVTALLLAGAVCLRRNLAQGAQIAMGILLLGGVLFCLTAALRRTGGEFNLTPAFSQSHAPMNGVFTVFALSPWAFSGFESISHSAGEARFSLKRTFRILCFALFTGAVAYIALILLAVSAFPPERSNWQEYISQLGNYSGIASHPTFYAAHALLGTAGSVALGVAALMAMLTGLVGNMVALSRLVMKLAEDGVVPAWLGKLNRDRAPQNAIFVIVAISIPVTMLGRTAISWIVDVTTVGATIAYAFTSASVLKTAQTEKDTSGTLFGAAGLAFSLMFVAEFMIPNLTSVKTLATESYLILSAWCILGFLFFRHLLIRDKEGKYGRSILVWTILLGVIIFTSTVWMRQNMQSAAEKLDFGDSFQKLDIIFGRSVFTQVGLIVLALAILFDINYRIQKRERQTEVEKALAEDASRAKTSFLSNMSHEIRSPMNSIIGLNRIALRDPDLKPETRRQLEKISASAKHLLELINEILDMSRIESGRMILRSEEFSFPEILDQVGIMIGGQCDDKGLTYRCTLVGQVPERCVGDGMKLKQVLINILGNSVKFTEAPGTVSLTAEALEAEEGRALVRFTMQDTGAGMDASFLPRIFEPFSQENGTSTNRYGGTGLGMAITKSFVDMMEGQILVESTKGVGSTFTVTLPLRVSEHTAASAPEEQTQPAVSLAGRRVLLAEDVPENAEILEDLLDLEEILHDYAENGAVAVQKIAESPAGYYDAVLMDMRMPVMGGVAATRAIRALPHPDATLPIIAMTANVFEEDIEETRQAGMDAHLTKPIDPDKMYKTLAKLIETRQKA